MIAQIRFIDNTDPAGIDHQVAQLGSELASTLVIVISKVCVAGFFPLSFYFNLLVIYVGNFGKLLMRDADNSCKWLEWRNT